MAILPSRPPPSAFPRLLGPGPTSPRFWVDTAAEWSNSLMDVNSVCLNPNVDHIIHPFVGTGATMNEAKAEALAATIIEEMQARNMYLGNGGFEQGTHEGTFLVHGEGSHVATHYLMSHADDLLDPGSWGGTSPEFRLKYTPFPATGRSQTADFSALMASKFEASRVSEGLCKPKFRMSDEEGVGNAGLLFYDAVLKFFADSATRPGWWPAAVLDSRYSTEKCVALRNSDGSITELTLSEYVAAYPPPAFNVSKYWLEEENKPFARWALTLTRLIASAAMYFGPDKGWRDAYPAMEIGNYNLYRGSNALDFDPGSQPFGGVNDYSWIRVPRAEILQDWSCPVFYAFSSYGRADWTKESTQDYFVRKVVESVRAESKLTTKPVAIWLPPPNAVVPIIEDVGKTTNFVFDASVMGDLCTALVDERVTGFNIFAPNQPDEGSPSEVQAQHKMWDDLDQVVDRVVQYAGSKGTSFFHNFHGSHLMPSPPRVSIPIRQ